MGSLSRFARLKSTTFPLSGFSNIMFHRIPIVSTLAFTSFLHSVVSVPVPQDDGQGIDNNDLPNVYINPPGELNFKRLINRAAANGTTYQARRDMNMDLRAC